MNIWRRHIPTILGFLILIGGVFGGIYLVQREGIWFLKAEPKAVPREIKFTNISGKSFTVSWITEKRVIGFIKYGITPSLEKTNNDERDEISGQTTPFLVHQVRISNLQPAAKYYFKIGSEKKLFDNQGQPYEITTGPVLEAPPLADTVYGTILKPNGLPAEGVIVYLTLANAVPLSALSKSDGNWAIPLSVVRTADLSSYIIYDSEASMEEIFVQGGDLGTATAVVTTKDDSPVPSITMGKSYDFRKKKAAAEAVPTPGSEGSKFSLSPMSTPSASQGGKLTIINPEEEEKIATSAPEIRGKGPSGETIRITVESAESFTGEVVVNQDGGWSWTPPAGLLPGDHTVTAALADGTKVSHSFTVLASGEAELPSFTATPSAEASPSPTLMPTTAPTPTLVLRKSMPATEGGVPHPGILTPTLIFAILGAVLTFTGLWLNFKLDF